MVSPFTLLREGLSSCAKFLMRGRAPTGYRAPLCEFLDMPVPDHAFPFGNQTAVFQERVRAKTADLLMDQLKWCGSALIVSVAVGVGSWLAWSRA